MNINVILCAVVGIFEAGRQAGRRKRNRKDIYLYIYTYIREMFCNVL